MIMIAISIEGQSEYLMWDSTLKSFGNYKNLIKLYDTVIKHCVLWEKILKICKSKISVIKCNFNFSN